MRHELSLEEKFQELSKLEGYIVLRSALDWAKVLKIFGFSLEETRYGFFEHRYGNLKIIYVEGGEFKRVVTTGVFSNDA